MSAFERVLERLEGVQRIGPDSAKARCPAHEDRSPSFSVSRRPGKAVLHCFAGCDTGNVVAAMGLTMSDLFDEPRARIPRARFRKETGEALRQMAVESLVIKQAAEAMGYGRELEEHMRERVHRAREHLDAAAKMRPIGDLKLMAHEAVVVAVAAENMALGVALSREDRRRLLRSAAVIVKARRPAA